MRLGILGDVVLVSGLPVTHNKGGGITGRDGTSEITVVNSKIKNNNAFNVLFGSA